MPWFFIIFLVIPLLEIWLLIEIGSVLGGLSTILLVLATAILGVAMLRKQSLNTLLRFNQRLASGELPAQELLSGVFLLVSGAFLLTPGFVTDSIGFLFLIPSIRVLLANTLIEKGMLKAVHGFDQKPFNGGVNSDADNNPNRGNTYEGSASEYHDGNSNDEPRLK